MRITWLGHAAFILEGSKTVLIDPFISGNPKAPLKATDLKADVIAVTHGHGDHLGDAIEISKANNCSIVCIYELSRIIGKNAVGMNIGGTAEVEGVLFTMTPALHSADVEIDGKIVSAGCAAGFVIEMDGIRVYHAGDTGVFYDMKLIGELYEPDVALIPIGGWYTMGPKEAAKAVELIKPKIVVPMHYGTFPVISGSPEEFKELVEDKCPGVKVVILNPGESFEV